MAQTTYMQYPLSDRQPTLRVRPQPNDANPNGDIFGGWLMANVDIAGAIEAIALAKGPVVTVAVQQLLFIKPIYVHDLVSFYAVVEKIGHTSVTIKVEVYAQRLAEYTAPANKVSEATVVYVAVTEPGKPRPILDK